MRLPTHRPTSPSHHPHVLHPSLPLRQRPFSHHGGPLHSLRHTMTHSMPTRLIRSTVLSHHCSPLLTPLARRVASQAVPSVVCPPRSCTARTPPHLPTLHPAHAWHHLWLHRVRRRLRIIPSPHRHPRPLLHALHLHQRPLPAPAPPSLVLPLPSSSPSPSAAQSRIATSHTSKQTGSSTT